VLENTGMTYIVYVFFEVVPTLLLFNCYVKYVILRNKECIIIYVQLLVYIQV